MGLFSVIYGKSIFIRQGRKTEKQETYRAAFQAGKVVYLVSAKGILYACYRRTGFSCEGWRGNQQP